MFLRVPSFKNEGTQMIERHLLCMWTRRFDHSTHSESLVCLALPEARGPIWFPLWPKITASIDTVIASSDSLPKVKNHHVTYDATSLIITIINRRTFRTPLEFSGL